MPHTYPNRRAPAAAALLGLISLLGSACGAATMSTAVPTPININDFSMPPAQGTTTPEPVGSLAPIPSVAPPSGDPVVGGVAPEYTLAADDPEAFATAYRSIFEGADLDDHAVATAGARLCTYLMRQADEDGTVRLEDAVTEADLSEPGYARDAWVAAFGAATTHYCSEFEVIQ